MILQCERSRALHEVRPRKDQRGMDLISNALPFGRLWYEGGAQAVEMTSSTPRLFDRLHQTTYLLPGSPRKITNLSQARHQIAERRPACNNLI